jgi:mannose-6-phosphate isomerase-like protein (cupin superfamily)
VDEEDGSNARFNDMSAMNEDGGGEAPLVVRESAIATEGKTVRFELTLYPRTRSNGTESELSHERWPIDFPTEHVHPHQDEHWRVVSGELAVVYGGTESVLIEDESVTLPAGVPHRVWNPIDEPSRVVLEFRPAHEAQSLTETLFVLGQLGEIDENGHMSVLQFAVTQAAHPEHLYLTAIPVRLQKLLVTLLAPLGRRLGYRPAYSLDWLESDR